MDQRTYRNFDLILERMDRGYRARVLDSPSGQSAWVEATLPFSVAELATASAMRWRAGNGRAYRVGEEKPAPFDPQQFGQRLYAALVQGEIQTCLNRSLAQVEQVGEGLRLRLRLNDAPDLAALPWEYLCAPPPYGFFALSRQTPLVRYLDLPQTQRSLMVAGPLNVLAVIADPERLAPRLDVEREWQRLQQELGALQAEGRLTLERLPAPTVEALQLRLTQPPAVHILHFIGHGRFNATTHSGELLLEDGQRGSRALDADALSTLLYDHTTLRLVFLNVCEGAHSDPADLFSGLAQRLVQRRLPAVIAMQYTISDAAAIQLTAAFYRALAAGDPVDAALCEARKALYTQRQRMEWGTPVLFLRAPDGRLFDLPPRAQETQGGGRRALPGFAIL